MVSSVEDCDRVREGDTVIGLVEVEPELARMLTVAEREEARGFALRVGIVEKDDDPARCWSAQARSAGSFWTVCCWRG